MSPTKSYHSVNDIDVNQLVIDLELNDKIVKSKRRDKTEYYNIPCAFDIETSSFYINGEKNACMYVWQFGINGYCIVGRTWGEFVHLMNELSTALELGEARHLIVYVHNLSYEFQWMRLYFEWSQVFAIDSRAVAYAITNTGIEFKCSYILSGKSLKKVGDDLIKYKVDKMVGDLDYKLIRHELTPLNDKEIGYIINDIKVVMAYIQEKIEQDGDITNILLTKTSYVRKYCRDACFYNGIKSHKKVGRQYKDYTNLIKSLKIEDADEYNQLKRAFMGGFTHANPFHVEKVCENVVSYDFSSSYPASLVMSNCYPMSSSEIVRPRTEKEFRRNLKYYCCLFDIEFVGLRSKIFYESYIPSSKCFKLHKEVINNGRVVSADLLAITITEQDFDIIEQVYEWDEIHLGTFRRYQKNYLPTELVKSILKLYGDKTQLKGVEASEVDYALSKELLNSVYGCMVTDICKGDQTYNNIDGWGYEPPDIEELINKYNKQFQRFNFYPWGVWCTAISRHNLWTGIIEFKNDYIYSDTDSLKVMNYEKHKSYIEKYNDNCNRLMSLAMKYHGLDEDLTRPKTIKGIEKPIGVWDFEGVYDKFKTLGAKRYMVEKDGKINITVSGLNKKVCVPYITNKFSDPFKGFNDNLYIPPEYTGKSTHTYIDYETSGTVTDYKGITHTFNELSSVHMEPAEYSLSLADAFIKYLKGIQEVKC